MGLVITGNNQLAFDAVCCAIIGVDPLSVPHIRLAYEAGFGPVDLDQIEIGGEVTLQEAKARAKGFRVGLIRVEEYFEGTNIKAYAGPPPSDTTDYCWGGCPGSMEEAVEIMRLFDDRTDAKMPKTHIVFGDYKGAIDAKEGENVVFSGDCASYEGNIAGELVQIKSKYVDRSTKNPLDAKSDDIFVKMGKMTGKLWNAGKGKGREGKNVIRMEGCPVSVAEQVLLLVKLGKLKNPYFDMDQATPFVSSYFGWRIHELMRRMLRMPYQLPGESLRGAARPPQNLPTTSESKRLPLGSSVPEKA